MATEEVKKAAGAPAGVKKQAPTKKKSGGFKGIKSAIWVIIACFIIAEFVYNTVFGNPANFVDGDREGAVLNGNLMGTIYKGGVVVPIIQTLLLTVIALSIERFFALRTAFGRGSLGKFVRNIKSALEAKDLVKAQELCDKQRGSVANVVGATLDKYREMEANAELNKDQKVLSIQQALEEATALEMPTLQQNLPVIATIASLGTLTGLLGTVTGMIKSFAALAAGGGTDSLALSTGISEALINTAFGIFTGALAVIAYNYYTNKIDTLTYGLDEVGFSIVQTFSSTH
jgi:biopolymer transport protein ExbB